MPSAWARRESSAIDRVLIRQPLVRAVDGTLAEELQEALADEAGADYCYVTHVLAPTGLSGNSGAQRSTRRLPRVT